MDIFGTKRRSPHPNKTGPCQDDYSFDPIVGCACVADGIGTSPQSEIGANVACTLFWKYSKDIKERIAHAHGSLENTVENVERLFQQFLREACTVVHMRNVTFTGCLLYHHPALTHQHELATFVHAGDTRGYLYDGNLRQLTGDHYRVMTTEEYIRIVIMNGWIPQGEYEAALNRIREQQKRGWSPSIIQCPTQCIGTDETGMEPYCQFTQRKGKSSFGKNQCEANIFSILLSPRDRIILMTDGIYGNFGTKDGATRLHILELQRTVHIAIHQENPAEYLLEEAFRNATERCERRSAHNQATARDDGAIIIIIPHQH